MKVLSLGKLRGLQRCATGRGALAVFALDHRNNLRNALRPDAPDTVTPVEMAAFKQEVIAALAPVTSAVLLDPEVGAAQCIAAGVLPGPTGLVLALDATGYTGDPTARQSQILPGWSVEKAKRLGADAIKLLVYYHPSPYVFDPDQAKAMAQAGADQLVAHVGLTTAGTIGAAVAFTLDEAIDRVMAIAEAGRSARKDVIVICHGGPFDEPDKVGEALARMPGINGFFGASSIERLPTERAIRGQVEAFKLLTVAK